MINHILYLEGACEHNFTVTGGLNRDELLDQSLSLQRLAPAEVSQGVGRTHGSAHGARP